MTTNKITVEVLISARRKDAWTLWTLPEHIVNWNFASDDWHCPTAENDLRPGGKLRSRMEARDGSLGFDFEATYTEVADMKSISYEMTDGRHATTGFESVGNKTRLTISFDAESENPVEMQRAGWQAILENFKKYAEGN